MPLFLKTKYEYEFSVVNTCQPLGQLHLLNARLTLLNVLSIVHSTQFLGKLDELPQMK